MQTQPKSTSESGQFADILCVMQEQNNNFVYPGYTSEEILSHKQYFWNIVRGVNDEILSR